MFNKIIRDAPKDVQLIIAGLLAGLCRRLNVPQKETAEYIRRIRKDGDMGYLWANMEKMDIQRERRNTRKQTVRADKAENLANAEKARADSEKNRADNEKNRADKAENQHERDIAAFISTLREFVPDREEAKRRLMEKLLMDEQTAEEKMGDIWP